MNIEPQNFINNLYYMGVGLLGIFIVIILIIIVTEILNAVTVSVEKKNKKTDSD